MPTSPRKARILLKQGKAKVVRRSPFTIQLCYASGENKQEVVLGVDAGYQTIGFSALSKTKELISGELELLKGMSERLKERSMYRRQKRSNLRYRSARFDNRKKKKGWLAPSIEHKLNSHIKLIDFIKSLLPVTKVIVEVANFDIQKIKNLDIEGKQYQNGEQKGFWNIREYVLHRDNHQCQNPDCKNRSKNKILEVHHIGFRKKDRSDRPSNLITLCQKCHNVKNHQPKGFLYGWQPKLKSFKPESFMSIVRWRVVNILKCYHTYGYETKSKRIKLKLEKTHVNDAFCIAGGDDQQRTLPMHLNQKKKNNRSLEKFYDAKYIDLRTGKILKGVELASGRRCRNKNLDGENLKKYRKEKKSKGRRQIRYQKYDYTPGDLVRVDNNIFKVKGVFNKGKWIRVMDKFDNIKNFGISKVTLLKYNQWFTYGY
ncbi:5-methylcytosine-specific restriction enzyme A [Candidatus Magnetomoraceae bacterium gMMP-15]